MAMTASLQPEAQKGDRRHSCARFFATSKLTQNKIHQLPRHHDRLFNSLAL
jgi:hypothetical protein